MKPRQQLQEEPETNPDVPQQAVALKYDIEQDRAPKVVAKGRGHVAENILAAAQQNSIPVYQNNDFLALRLAIRTCARADFLHPRVARIRDTLTLSELEISEALLPDVEGRDDVEIISGPFTYEFDADGYMEDFKL